MYRYYTTRNGADELVIIDKHTFSYNTDENSNLWLLFNIYIKYHFSTNIDQEVATAANQIEHRQRRPQSTENNIAQNAHLSQFCFPSWTWAGCTSSFLPVDGGSYLGCSRGKRALLAWVHCLCLDRKDWARPEALECSHRLCCCRAEDCERQNQVSAVCGNTIILNSI